MTYAVREATEVDHDLVDGMGELEVVCIRVQLPMGRAVDASCHVYVADMHKGGYGMVEKEGIAYRPARKGGMKNIRD